MGYIDFNPTTKIVPNIFYTYKALKLVCFDTQV